MWDSGSEEPCAEESHGPSLNPVLPTHPPPQSPEQTLAAPSAATGPRRAARRRGGENTAAPTLGRQAGERKGPSVRRPGVGVCRSAWGSHEDAHREKRTELLQGEDFGIT